MNAKDKGLAYVAGPYTHPDPVENTHNAIRAGMLLREAGYCPVIPHLSLLAHIVCPRPPEFWYEWDLRLMDRCDFMLRLPGESWGADREEEYAAEIGIAVYRMTAEEFLEAAS
jgi:nucleoside 2-deoxyribosyltransferase